MSEYFVAEVVSVSRISPNMIRIVFAGEALSGFQSSGRPDEWTRLMFPVEQGAAVALPVLTDGKWRAPAHCPMSPARPYTVRRWSPCDGELTIDFVVHEGGIAASWAQAARCGDTIVVSAPFGRFTPPEDTDWIILLADITGLPAVARIIEEMTVERSIAAHVELPDAGDQQAMHGTADTHLHWYDSFGKTAQPTQLAEIARGIELPAGRGYLYIAGEATAASEARKHFRDVLGFDKDRITSVGYWIEGQARG
jgi:NADPH-dependent ferric siderophore reductase